MYLLILLFVVIIFLFVTNKKTLMEMKSLATDVTLNNLTKDLPSNEMICKEIQNIVGSKCDIKLDDEAKSSAYIFFQNKIILSNTKSNKEDYSRVLFIAHECVHSVQSKMMHIINFVVANIKNLYDVILFFVLILGKGSLEMITISFLISFLSFYYRITLETDAVYRSVILARKYLGNNKLSNVADRYEYIVPKTISGMYFSYITPALIRLTIFMVIYVAIGGV